MVVIDESGFKLNMCLPYARSQKGHRIKISNPIKSNNVSVIGAISCHEVIELGVIESSINANSFELFLEKLLLPKLSPGQIIVLDNCPTHKPEKIEEICKKFKIGVIFLPPYSPDYSPIEMMWAKIKNFVRRDGPRTIEKLFDSIKIALQKITRCDLESWFEHCGYDI